MREFALDTRGMMWERDRQQKRTGMSVTSPKGRVFSFPRSLPSLQPGPTRLRQESLRLSCYADPEHFEHPFHPHAKSHLHTRQGTHLLSIVQTLHVVILGGNTVGRLLSVGVALCWVCKVFKGEFGELKGIKDGELAR